MNFPIDFVVTWVDGSDPIWRKKKSRYDGSVDTSKKSMNSEKAYRDWGTFKYWFRGVEKFAPWVNKVYLVTDNQKPDWLDISNEKLVIVDHREIKYNTALSPIIPERFGTGNFQINDMEIITSYFSRNEILKNGQFFNPKQGLKNIVKSLLYRNSQFICGFWESHLPYPLLKSTMDLVWEKEKAILEKTSASIGRLLAVNMLSEIPS